jgi:hypothetical protein
MQALWSSPHPKMGEWIPTSKGTCFLTEAKYHKLVFRLGSKNKAKVAIANRLARTIYRVLGGYPFKDIGYMRGDPHEEKVRRLVAELRSLGVNIKQHNHQMIVDSVRKVTVDNTGIVLQ